MTDADADAILLAMLKSFGEGGLDRAAFLANLAAALPGVNWPERMLHAEAAYLRIQPGPALPDWLL